jgi:hypothetical protein
MTARGPRQQRHLSDADCAPAVSPDAGLLNALRAFEVKLGLVAKSARLLPAVTARNAFEERLRLASDLQSGEMPKPRFEYAAPRACHANLRWLDHLRAEASQLPAASLYRAKIDELELDVAMLASLGDSRNLRPLAARRFGTGDELIDTVEGPVRLIDYSLRLLTGPSLRRRERPTVPADAGPGELCLRGLVEHVAAAAGLHVSVRVEPNLTAGAATGDRTVFIADRSFTSSRRRSCRRRSGGSANSRGRPGPSRGGPS